ncbi:hypothetical protein [Lentzea sp. NPDC051838]|uniref:hypothetical protein n=1 Tax=Lentzea sp. NPDC051838 TaxID=3154849 RepID=UPI0034261BAE
MSEEPPPFTETQIVDWLIDECRDVAGRITAVTTSGDRIFATGSTVTALAATVAIGGGKGYLLMWFPFAVSIVLLHGLYLKSMVRNLIGYQLGLEEEITRRAGLPLVTWQSYVRESGQPHRQIKLLLFPAAAVYVASAVAGLAQALHTTTPGAWGHERAWLYITLTVASVVVGTGLVIYSYVSQRGTTRAATTRLEEAFAAVRPSGSAAQAEADDESGDEDDAAEGQGERPVLPRAGRRLR